VTDSPSHGGAGARANILLITCHDLGRHLACHGVSSVRSPHLDRLAHSGLLFPNAFTTAPQCSPARGALATGRYPHCIGLLGLAHPPYGWDLHRGEKPVASVLGRSGYRTHLFGFQHISPDVDRLGFEHVHAEDGRDVAEPRETTAAWVSEQVGAWLGSAGMDGPFYAEVNLHETHRPYDRGDAQPYGEHDIEVPSYLPDVEESRAELAALQGAIRQADAGVGRILHHLDEAGLTGATAVIFVSDHGLAMPRAKCTLYDPGIEVTLMMRLPGELNRAGRRVDELVSTVSVMATICDLARVSTPRTVQGRSLLPLMLGDATRGEAEIFAEKTFHSYYDPMRAIRTDRHKLIRNFETTPLVEFPSDVRRSPIVRAHRDWFGRGIHPPVELYDLEEDPWEANNLADSREHENTRDGLDGRLLAWMRETGDPLFDGVPPSPRTRQALI
jgi:N-sulfoglucosamine sulfohydrolase